jgi:hypothetical protein
MPHFVNVDYFCFHAIVQMPSLAEELTKDPNQFCSLRAFLQENGLKIFPGLF